MFEKLGAEIGVLGGSGVYALDGIREICDVEISTPYGAPSSPIRLGIVKGRRVAFISRHGKQDHALLPTEVPYRANIYALKMLGVTKVLTVGAVGSLKETLPPGSLVVPDQFFERTRHSPDTFFGDGVVCHVSMADPFSQELRNVLIDSAELAGQPAVDGGVYTCIEGPQFSTRAESRYHKQLGFDIVGMTTITEARLCREAEIAFAALCIVTDYDSWRPEEPGVEIRDVHAQLRRNSALAQRILSEAVYLCPDYPLPENRVLDRALCTPVDAIPEPTLRRLEAILRPYLPARAADRFTPRIVSA